MTTYPPSNSNITDLLNTMPRQAFVLLLNTAGTDNEKILMQVSDLHQQSSTDEEEKKDRDGDGVNEMKCVCMYLCACL